MPSRVPSRGMYDDDYVHIRPKKRAENRSRGARDRGQGGRVRDPGPSSQPAPAAPRQGPGREYRWMVLAVAFFGVFGALGFGRFGYSAVLPSMQKALQHQQRRGGLAGFVEPRRLHGHGCRGRECSPPSSDSARSSPPASPSPASACWSRDSRTSSASLRSAASSPASATAWCSCPLSHSWPPGSTRRGWASPRASCRPAPRPRWCWSDSPCRAS